MTEPLPTLITRAEAKALGLKMFFTGKPCKRGHTSERYVSNIQCKPCKSMESSEYYSINREDISEKQRIYYLSNTDKILKKQKEQRKTNVIARKESSKNYWSNNKEKLADSRRSYRLNNKDTIRSTIRAWRERNRDRTRMYSKVWRDDNKNKRADYARRFQANNRGYVNSRAAMYRARKLRATPPITSEELEALNLFYDNCPNGYHVDHIFPLNGPNCSGLHVLRNLQYLPAKENIRKSNRVPDLAPLPLSA